MRRHGPNCLRGPRTRRPNSGGDPVAPGRRRTSSGRPPENAPIRADLVRRVRREIAEGTYDTPQKLEAAVARMLEEIE